MSKPVRVGVCVGHSRKGDRGATSVSGMTEWAFNSDLALQVCGELGKLGIASFVSSKYEGNGYGAAMSWIAEKMDQVGVTHAVELHFNAADGKAHGHEWLHWHSSTGGQKLAAAIHAAYKAEFPENTDRGLKEISGEDRGGGFLRKTRCPAVICEPFFGDNPGEWAFAVANKSRIARVIAAGIANAVLH